MTKQNDTIEIRVRETRKFLEGLKSKLAVVDFVKANGEERTIVFNPMDRNDIKGTGRTTPDHQFNVREIRSQKWKSFVVTRPFRIKCGSNKIEFSESL